MMDAMNEKDAQLLLKKYMHFVLDMEGTTFIPPIHGAYILTRYGFTAEEQDILYWMDEEIQQEVDNIV